MKKKNRRPAARHPRQTRATAAALVIASAFFLTGRPTQAQTQYTWTGATDSDFGTTTNWSGGNIAPTNSTSNTRLNVSGANPLIYTAAQGVTVYDGAGRGLVIGNGTNGSMIITGGTFSTTKATATDIIGNGLVDTVFASLTVDGGHYVSNGLGVEMGLSGPIHSTLTIDSGSATISTLKMAAAIRTTEPVMVGDSTVNLNGGVLQVSAFAYGVVHSIPPHNYDALNNGANSINFNGGLLRAGANNAAYLPAGWGGHAFVKSGGARIDSNGFNIAFGQALETHPTSTGGGLTKSGAGAVTLEGVNTYTGPTAIETGTLALGAAGSLAASSAVEIGVGAIFDTSARSFTLLGGQTISFNLDGAAGGSAGLLQAGALDISAGAVSFTVTGAPLDDSVYVIANYTSLVGVSFATVDNLAPGYEIDYHYLGGNQIALVASAIPEPSAWSVLAGGAVLLAVAARRRRR